MGWLLLFVPGFVALAVMSWLGWSATRRSQLHWLAYSLLISLTCELLVRESVDRILPGWADPALHPVHRGLALLLLGGLIGFAVGMLQYNWRFNRLVWWLLRESAMPTVWLAYFRNPATASWLRVETADGKTMVAHVDVFTIDPSDANQELILTDMALKTDHGWETLPGPVYMNGKQIALAFADKDPDVLKAALSPD